MSDAYKRRKDRTRKEQSDESFDGRDIAIIAEKAGRKLEVKNPERRAKAKKSLQFYCDSYFPLTFYMPWSDDHLKIISKIERAVLRGGLFAMAMPRGSGKTSLAEVASMWAISNHHREFVCLIGSDEDSAKEMLASIKAELETNDLLDEDYWKTTWPIRCLEGISLRAKGQHFKGTRTQMSWTTNELVLPTMSREASSGACIRVAGLTGQIRGMKFKRPDGRTARPDLVIPDDPQTDESARSPSQCKTRVGLLAGAVLGLAGPGKKISGIMPCTVICPGDMADQILDSEKYPQWQGERTKMIYSFPTDEKLWEQYATMRAEGFRQGDEGKAATEFYSDHRDEMDLGAEVAWFERFNHDELSAIQHAMNLRLQDERAFWSEYQNEPLSDELPGGDQLTADQIADKLNGMDRGRLPISTTHLSAYIDVHQSAMFYVVVAWDDSFSGQIIDYGTWPDQQRLSFTLADSKRTLALESPSSGLEGSIYNGLEQLSNEMLGREWPIDGGALMKIERCLIDANWGQSTDIVYQFCRQSAFSSILLPSHGRFVGATSIPYTEYKRRQGERLGHYWRIPNTIGKRAIRHVLYDTNYWKSFINSRLAVSMGDAGCLSLWGRKPDRHRLFADHVVAEYPVRAEAKGRTVDEWKWRPGRPDNHWLDCLVGCAVAASILGVSLKGTQKVRGSRDRKPISLAALQNQRR